MASVSYRFPGLRRATLIGTLAATMLIGLAACGGTSDSAGSNSASVATSATATPAMGTDMSTMTADTIPTAAVTPASGQAATNAVEIQATLREWGLDLSQTEVAAGTVRFVVGNTGQFPHNFTIKDASGTVLSKTPNFAAAQGPQTVEVTLAPGTYTVYCSLPGHEQRGQKNTLVVK